MMNFITWDSSDTALRLGHFALHWYSLCWLIGLVLAYLIVHKLFREQKIKEELFEPLFIYCFVGILVGARLVHCLFYQPDVFLTSWKHFIEIFIPIEIFDDGGWKFTGYRGLASHGGTLGLMLALWLYYRRTRVPLWQVLDNIAIATPVTATFIRLGNLMNSEIVGKVTDLPWGFYFVQAGPVIGAEPRHPGQLYEAMAYFVFFFIGWYLYRRHAERVGTGYFFGLCLTLIFTFRFFIEFTKDVQVGFEQHMLFNMGQLLSLPFIALGAWCMYKGAFKGKKVKK